MVMAVQSKEIILIPDIDTHKKPIIKKSQRMFAENYRTKNCAIVPLICQDRVVGVLNLADKMDSDRFMSGDFALIELFSQLVGASIGNIKLFEKIQRQATTDGLTGLVNHRTFYEILEKELWRSRRYGGRISLIMIDVDNLKSINDAFGHRAGFLFVASTALDRDRILGNGDIKVFFIHARQFGFYHDLTVAIDDIDAGDAAFEWRHRLRHRRPLERP